VKGSTDEIVAGPGDHRRLPDHTGCFPEQIRVGVLIRRDRHTFHVDIAMSDMASPSLQRQLTELRFLLLLAVSLLAGLVFGRDAYAEMQAAVLTFVVLGTALRVSRSLSAADGE
jgi:hypothetical protein